MPAVCAARWTVSADEIGHEGRLAAAGLAEQEEVVGASGVGEEAVDRVAHPLPPDEVPGAALNQLAVVDNLGGGHGFTDRCGP
jgi:hypothetical protein